MQRLLTLVEPPQHGTQLPPTVAGTQPLRPKVSVQSCAHDSAQVPSKAGEKQPTEILWGELLGTVPLWFIFNIILWEGLW